MDGLSWGKPAGFHKKRLERIEKYSSKNDGYTCVNCGEYVVSHGLNCGCTEGVPPYSWSEERRYWTPKQRGK